MIVPPSSDDLVYNFEKEGLNYFMMKLEEVLSGSIESIFLTVPAPFLDNGHFWSRVLEAFRSAKNVELVTVIEAFPYTYFQDIDEEMRVFGMDLTLCVKFQYLIINGSVSFLFLTDTSSQKKDIEVALILDSNQTRQLLELHEFLITREAQYRFHPKVSLRSLRGNILQYDSKGELHSVLIGDDKIETIDLGIIEDSSLEEFIKNREKPPKDYRKKKKKYRKMIEYKWIRKPPSLPKDAKKDPIYEEWDRFQKDYSRCISQCKTIIKETRKALEEELKNERLKGFKVGKLHLLANLEEELEVSKGRTEHLKEL